MADMLEDPDGAPYPDEVQQFYYSLSGCIESNPVFEMMTEKLVDALESVARRNDD